MYKRQVVDLPAQCFGHGTVDLIGVHDCREDILLTTHDLNGCFVGILIELLGELVATVIVKICLLYTSHTTDNREVDGSSPFWPTM